MTQLLKNDTGENMTNNKMSAMRSAVNKPLNVPLTKSTAGNTGREYTTGKVKKIKLSKKKKKK